MVHIEGGLDFVVTDNKRVRKSIRQLQKFKTWQLVIVLIFMVLLAATFLRLNNIGMVQRLDAVKAADKDGDTDLIHDRLYDLQRYSSVHMNAGTGQFYLTEQYKRDSQKAVKAASTARNPHGNIYKKASEVCDRQFSYYSMAYTQCFVSELNKYPSATGNIGKVDLPKPDLYRYEFVSPLISFDFAGLSVGLCAILVLAILTRIVSLLILRAMLKRHYSSI